MEPVLQRNEIRIHIGINPRNPFSIEDARVAVISYLFSKKNSGQLIGSIQDLDSKFPQGSIENLRSRFKWLGIEFDEDPFQEMGASLFWQSHRIEIYKNFLVKLLQDDKAFIVSQDEKKFLKIFKKNGTNTGTPALNANSFRHAPVDEFWDSEFEVFLKENPEFKMKENPAFASKELKVEANETKLWCLGGRPTKHFASCIDRHLLQISHVFCCDKQEVNCRKEVKVANAFGWKPTHFIVIPGIEIITNQVTNSINPHPQSVDEMQRLGYFSRVVMQYLGRGSDCVEVDQSANFTFFNSNVQFEIDDLNLLNRDELQRLEVDTVLKMLLPFLKMHEIVINDLSRLKQILSFVKMHSSVLSQLAEDLKVFDIEYQMHYSSYARSILRRDCSQKVLWSFLRKAESVEFMTKKVFLSSMKSVQHETGILGKDLWDPVRIALTGDANDYELASVAEVLGKACCVKRIRGIVGNFWQ